jgi:hypothetical protein
MIERIIALLGGLRSEDIDNASPVQRRQFAALCRHWASLAELRNEATKPGILRDLKNGDRSA